MKNLAIFASGNGSNAENIIKHFRGSNIANVKIVICNKETAPVIDKARKLEPRSWVMVTAKITAEKHPLYKGDLGPVLTAELVEPAEPANPDVATF